MQFPHLSLQGYLNIYKQNKSNMLQQVPQQTYTTYELAVYTTWEISFKRLSPITAQLLQLWGLIHFENITEEIFQTAAEYTPGGSKFEPYQNKLQAARHFLSNLCLYFAASASASGTLRSGHPDGYRSILHAGPQHCVQSFYTHSASANRWHRTESAPARSRHVDPPAASADGLYELLAALRIRGGSNADRTTG